MPLEPTLSLAPEPTRLLPPDTVPVTPVVPASADPKKLLPDSANPFLEEYRDLGTNGTFLVYRKLEQDVAGFWNFMRVESERRFGVGDPLFMVRLASKMVGRWPSGAPLSPYWGTALALKAHHGSDVQ